MAKNNAKLVSVGKPVVTGALNAAPVGTPLPTDAAKPLNEAFVNLGYCGEDGVKNQNEKDSEDFKAFGGDVVLTVNTSRKETLSFTFIQVLDEDVLKEVYGTDNVTTSEDGTLVVKHNSKNLPHRSYVIEMLMSNGAVKRIVIPDCMITEIGEVTYKDDELVAYPVTLSCFPDKNGDTVIEYIAKAAA
ncbi:phage tail tube protein [Trueperella pyogenes]